MIDINLVPPALRKNGSNNANLLKINIPQDVLLGVGSGLILLFVTVHLILGAICLVGMVRYSQYNAQWQKVLPDKTILDGIFKESGDLKKKINLISDMTTKKMVLWAPKLNVISDSVPRGVWIRRMTLEKVGLTIEGSVVSKTQNEINNVGIFVTALKKSDYFMNDFSSLEENSIQGGKSNVIEVTDFSVLAKLKTS